MSAAGTAQAATNEPVGCAEQRRLRGVSLEAIAEATKISMMFLRAIEAAEFGKLPGGVYNTNYIRQYAACAGIDELSILARYSAFRASLGDASGALQPTSGRTSRL